MRRISLNIFAAFTLSTAISLPGVAAEKPAIKTAADLPRTVFELPQKPSVLVKEGGSGFDALRDQLQSDAEMILTEYRLEDAATERELRGTLRNVALLEQRWEDAIAESERIQALEDKPAAKATSGFVSTTYAVAALEAGTDSGEAFEQAYAAELQKRVEAMDFKLVADTLQATKGQFELLTPALLEGSVAGSLDPNAEAQGMAVQRDFAATIIGARRTLEILPLKEIIVATLSARLASEAEDKPDLWTERLVSLEGKKGLQTVPVGVWDSGTDPELFADSIYVNENEQLNGRDDDDNGFIDDRYGIAFGYDWKRSSRVLRPMPEGDLENMSELIDLVKGALDIRASLHSPAAQAYRKHVTTLEADEVLPFSLQMGRLGLYLHGTSTAYTSVVDNPAAKVLPVRFDQDVKAVPDAMDEETAAAFAAHVKDSIDYMKAAGVRVVNMSWRMTAPQIEASLASVEPDAEKRKARATAIFDSMNQALVDGFKSAPEILFVPGAGNEDEDVEFVRSFPAGINLPNVLTVGAVDVALQPASFTSYGKSIDLYANGFEVPSKVPGGADINLSGTSLAAPQVTNLAAKMLAIDPTLSVADLRRIIEETATEEGENRLPVINPEAAIARVASGE